MFKNRRARIIQLEEELALAKSTDGNYTARELAEIVAENDIVEVIENNGSPYILATPKTKKSIEGLAIYEPRVLSPDSIHYGTFNEPSHSERAAGRPVQALPASVPAQRVRLADVAGGNPTGLSSRSDVNLNELGSSSPSPWLGFMRREYNPDLVGMMGLRVYDKMRRNDGVVKGTLRSVKTPVLSARWFMVPCDKNKVADVNVAAELWTNLTQEMTIGWTQVLTEALLMCDFGHYMFEIVWTEEAPSAGHPFGMYKIQKLAPRHPMDVRSWTYDDNGGVDGAWFYPNDYMEPDVWIPIDKLLVFSFDREAGNMEGISLLRPIYKHWYFKEQLYKIDAIQKERHGIGIPVIILPEGFDDNDKRVAEAIGRNLRTNERAHVTLPPRWQITFAKLEGQPVSAITSIEMHDNAIRENILLTFMSDKSNATGDSEKTAMFFKATRFIADIVCDTINLYLAPKYIAANYARVGTPILKARRIGEQQDWRTMSFAIRNLIGSGLLIPDDPLEAWMRDEMDMPEADPATARQPIQLDVTDTEPDPNDPNEPDETTDPGDTANPKQRSGKAGMPRQKATPSAGNGKSSKGIDNSGGK